VFLKPHSYLLLSIAAQARPRTIKPLCCPQLNLLLLQCLLLLLQPNSLQLLLQLLLPVSLFRLLLLLVTSFKPAFEGPFLLQDVFAAARLWRLATPCAAAEAQALLSCMPLRTSSVCRAWPAIAAAAVLVLLLQRAPCCCHGAVHHPAVLAWPDACCMPPASGVKPAVCTARTSAVKHFWPGVNPALKYGGQIAEGRQLTDAAILALQLVAAC
jgi:hypothetical protein